MLNVANAKTVGRPKAFSPDRLKGVALFSGLSDKEISRFEDAVQTRSYKKGAILYLQEEPAEYFYVICGGWIKLFHETPEGKKVIIGMLTTGHMVGEVAMFEQDCHTSSAQVVENVQLFSIPSSLLRHQMCLNPTLAYNMLSAMSLYYTRHNDQQVINAMQNAPQRIGYFLLKLCPEGRAKDIAFHLPYDKTLIADTLGMKGATFSRALNTLRQKAIIRVCGARVEIDSLEQLSKFVYGPFAA
jgi:CRP-like cAMP-binding protein